MIKKLSIILSAILILALCLSLAACGSIYKEYSVGSGKVELTDVSQNGNVVTLTFKAKDEKVEPKAILEFFNKVSVDECVISGTDYQLDGTHVSTKKDIVVTFTATDGFQVDDSKVHIK